jgi:low temperature requirement protein LtrA
VATLVYPPSQLCLWSTRGLGANRRVTWLELFFDLVFVAAIAQVGTPLATDYSIHGLSRYAFMLLLIWWAWHGFAMYVTRFDADDRVQRTLTFLQMVAVIFMAANAEDGLDSDSAAGFAAAYAVMRFMLVAQYVRAMRVPAARALARESALGMTIAAGTWLASALLPAPARYGLWTIAVAIELGLATRGGRHTRALPPDPAHLPERFGLFTLILLGESIVSLMKGIQAQPEWSPAAALSALLGIGLIFAIWYGYFEGAQATAERHVRSRHDARQFALWHHAHLPLYLGLVLTAIGVEHIIASGARVPLDGNAAWILCGATTCILVALTALAATSQRASHVHPHARPHTHGVLLSLAPLAVAPAATQVPAVLLISALATVCALHTLLVLRERR